VNGNFSESNLQILYLNLIYVQLIIKLNMKKQLLTSRLLLLTGIAFSSIQAVYGAQNKGYTVEFNQTRSSEMQLGFKLNTISISEVTINGTIYSKLNFEGSVNSSKKGYAELPILTSAVQLPSTKNVSVEAIPGNYTEYQLKYPLLPSRGTIYRNQNPALIPYVIDPNSVVDAWYPGNFAEATEPFIYRDVRGTTVSANAIQYNAAKKIVRVYGALTVKMTENNTPAINALETKTRGISSDMAPIYSAMFVNFNRAAFPNEIAAEHGDILIVRTARDAAAIKPYVNWKKQMGYNVFEKEVAVGTNVKSTIATEYSSNKKILYVLLVGDWEDIQCDKGSLSGNSAAPFDPMLGCVVGTDSYMDIYIGRFSAASSADVTAQVSKTISYEKNPSGTWYKTALHIASAEGAGQGDDGEADIAHEDNIWTGKLSKFTYTTKKTAYDPGASASTVSAAVNAGLSVINYTGHGSETAFVTTGFSNSDVGALTNEGKYPFIFSVACVNGSFNAKTCFAEAWLRKANGGAVATIMSTINQPWQPPMRGQDYMNDLLVGGHTYSGSEKGTKTDHGKTHFGAITANALVLMYAESAQQEDLETIKTWTVFGDPSVQVRTDEPKALVASKTDVPVTSFTTNVSVNGSPFANALVSIWDGTNQPFSALTDASGNVTIPHTLAKGTNVTLTITGFNLIPHIEQVTVGTAIAISVNNLNLSNAIAVLPNPNNGEFVFNYSLANNENASIRVLDVLGKVVYSDVLLQNMQSKRIALNHVENGIYFLEFKNSSGSVTKKINIQK
jgi:hypothetical protein